MRGFLFKSVGYFLLGIPVWIPVYFIVRDAVDFSPANPLFQLIAGADVSAVAASGRLFQYLFYFFPAIWLYVIFKSSGDSESMVFIDSKAFIAKSDMPSAMQVSWKSNDISGSPKNNRKWLEVKKGVFAFKSTYPYQAFTYPVIFLALLYFLIVVVSAVNGNNFDLMVFLNLGTLFFFAAIGLNVIFYLCSFGGFILKTKTNQVQLGADLVNVDQVKSLQVLTKQQTYKAGGGEIYNVYEVNFIYDGRKRSTVLNHGGLVDIVQQIKQLQQYFNVPIYVDEGVANNIDRHNEEVLLQG